jgi:hypothetical protein
MVKKTIPKKVEAKAPDETLAHPVQKKTLGHWLEAVRSSAAAAETGGTHKGACLLTDPNGGPNYCVQVDQATCTSLKGTWIDGDC